METENQSLKEESVDNTSVPGSMAPLESELAVDSKAQDFEDEQDGAVDEKQMARQEDKDEGKEDDGEIGDEGQIEDEGEIADEGEAGDAEDGEILEDGEIASDQDGEIIDNEQDETKEERSDSSKASPTKQRGGRHDDHGRRGHSRKDKHSKRRRSKEDAHKENRQKKKRHRDHGDYDKSDESGWNSDNRREKGDRKRDRSSRSPVHDNDSDKRRRGSGDNKHHSGRDRDGDRDKNRANSRYESRNDRHDKSDKDKKDRERHGKDKDKDHGKAYIDGYDSPPGIYDSPSDEEYEEYGKPKTMMSMVEDVYMDPSMADGEMEPVPKNKNKKQPKRKKEYERMRRRERDRQDDRDPDAPVKKKPLLQTPMDERPICRFFKEGKCQKGPECQFNHDYHPQKRLELCKYYVQSYCKRDGCVFLHEEFPCKYYHTGSTCYQGDNCKFSHEPLTKETEIALQNMLKDKDFIGEEEMESSNKKFKKKGLLGDGPGMSEEEIQHKLEKMKSIPSIFDIETHAPGESPSKPASKPQNNMGGVQGQGFFPDNGMSPQTSQGGPNLRFGAPANQPGPNRPPFIGPGGPAMDGPPMGMVPPMVSGPGILGPGPPGPMMTGQGAPGMQGPPMGPPAPMSQAAALVGAILRAAPMLQQYRGPNPQAPNTSLPSTMQGGDARFMGPNMDGTNMMNQGMNMNNQNMMGPGMNMDGSMMNTVPNMMGGPGVMNQDGMMGGPGMMNQAGMMGGDIQQQGMMADQQAMGPGFNPNQELSGEQQVNKPAGAVTSVRDPRKAGPQNDPRLNKGHETGDGDVDMRSGVEQGRTEVAQRDEDLRQDVDMRQEDSGRSPGESTPTQTWDDNEAMEDDDDMEIPAHLPPKQREMFMRIKQHTMKLKREKSEQMKQVKKEPEAAADDKIKMDDDKWYSSDEEEENKPNISNMLNTLTNPSEMKSEVTSSPQLSTQSSFNVMQMINAIKSQPTAISRPQDPRKQASQTKPVQEPANIHSREGDCPWRLCRVLYVKNRIPSNVDLNDQKYNNDPRVQKILKLQELESGKVIDHTKSVPTVRTEMYVNPNEPKIPDLLDPKVFKAKESIMPRPELTPFVDPRVGVKMENPNSGIPRQQDPRLKPALSDPRVQNKLNVPSAMSNRPLDPRLSRQDSNSNVSSVGTSGMPGNRLDPRFARQTSRDSPPLDPRSMNRQSSNDPRLGKPEAMSMDVNIIGKASDPRLAKVLDSEINQMAFQRQTSQPGAAGSEKEVTKDATKPKLDYRNDPRFKRKPVAMSASSPESAGKRYSGQRKSSTEYSSPLGESNTTQEESGYNSYNRPRPPKTQQQLSLQATSVPRTEILPPPSSELSTHDILDSLQIMPPPELGETQQPDKNLKDIFKTIDPTASPFC